MTATLRTPYRAATERIQFVAKSVMAVWVLSWVSWFYPFDDLLDRQGTPWGADFSMFYVAGRVAGSGHLDRLYDQAYHQSELHTVLPQLDSQYCLPYRYPPWVAMILAPLAHWPYAAAFASFLGVSLVLWLTTIRLLRNQTRWADARYHATQWWVLAGWPVAWETLIGGQASMLAALIAVATLLLVRSNRPVAAGIVLGIAAYKPNVLALFALGIIARYPRILWGLVPVALTLVAVTSFAGGYASLEEYVVLLQRLGNGQWDVETPYWKVHGFASWIALIAPGYGRQISLGIGIAASLSIAWWWRHRTSDQDVAFMTAAAGLLITNTLFNPYVPIYDLILVAPAAVLGAAAIYARHQSLAQRAIATGHGEESTAGPLLHAGLVQLVIATLFFGPHLSQAVSKLCGLQFFPWALIAVALWGVWTVERYGARTLVGGATSR